MAWSNPRTWVATFMVTAAQLNQEIRDNLNLLATYIETTTGRWAGEIKVFREATTTVAFVATPTFDLTLSNNFAITLTGNVTAITVSGWTAAKDVTAKLRITQDGTGGRTFVFPAGWKWSGGAAPAVAAGVSKTTIVMINSDDGGTTIYPALYTIDA